MAAPIGTIADQRAIFALIRRQCRAAGQSDEIRFLSYETNQLAQLPVVTEGWAFSEFDATGRRVPEGVQFELWVMAEQFTIKNINPALLSGVQYGGVIYQIERPSSYKPEGMDAFYRFWLSPQEDAA